MATRPRARRLSLLSVILLLLTSLGVIAFGPLSASATAGVDDYPMKNDAWCATWTGMNDAPPAAPTVSNCLSEYQDGWGFFKRECTSFVTWRMRNDNGFTNFQNTMTRTVNGASVTRSLSHAGNWGSAAADLGYQPDMIPAPGAVAWWSSGHVAWVKSVSGSNVTIEEYNFGLTHNYNATQRTIAASSVDGYIHFKDLIPSAAPALSRTLAGNFSGDSKEDLVYASKRSDGGTDLAIQQSNGSSGMSWQGVWLSASGIPFDSVTFIPADYDGDGLTDLYYATPKTGGGIDIALLRNTGSAFTYVGQQWNPSGLSLGATKFISGNFSGDSKGNFAYVTKRSDGGSDVAIWQSNGSSGMTWQGAWLQSSGVPFDSVTFIPADYDGDGLTDLYYATPRSGGGFDLALLRSTGSGFTYQGQQWNPSSPNLDSIKFISGNFSGDSKGDFAYVTPKSGGGSEIAVWRSNGSSGMTWQGVWISTSSIPFSTTSYVPADYDGDGLTDLYYVTPTSTGFDMALLGDSGTSLGYVGLQWQATLPLATTRFIPQG